MAQDTFRLDYESKSKTPIAFGTDRYSKCPSTGILMAAWNTNSGTVRQWDATTGEPMPAELRDALEDPDLPIWAFNASFERQITTNVARIITPFRKWRCTMAQAYMMSFGGGLADVGKAVGIQQDAQKDAAGKKLINRFCIPNRVTKDRPWEWNTRETHPDEWQDFLFYNRQDIVAESAIGDRLLKYAMPASEWLLYAIDQKINDIGIPVNPDFAISALQLARARQAEVIEELKDLTGLANPNSTTQILPWLKDRGYPFDDLKKDTVTMAMARSSVHLDEECRAALKMRQISAKSSLSKFDKLLEQYDPIDRVMRNQLQFAGGQRTSRWAGRGIQPQNLPRTFKGCEEDPLLTWTTEDIMNGRRDLLDLTFKEPLDVISGMVRSALQTPPGEEFRVADLSSIESVVQGWMTGCAWINEVLESGRDIYKSFGVHLYHKDYDDVTKKERNNSKPATLGGGYGMGGGDLGHDGKRGGLWGYAENMGIDMSKEESHQSVKVFRELCHEIVSYWWELDRSFKKCIRTGKTIRMNNAQKTCPIIFEKTGAFVIITLPSGRRMFYKDCKIVTKEMIGNNGKPWTAENISYMGWDQTKGMWIPQLTRGAKIFENLVQAISRDILKEGMIRSFRDGFNIRWSVHDELITSAKIEDDYHTLDRLIEHMTAPISWAPGLKLKAAGWCGWFYRKD